MRFVVALYPRVCLGLMPKGKVKLFIFDEYRQMYLKIRSCCIVLVLHLLASQPPAEQVSCEHFLIWDKAFSEWAM